MGKITQLADNTKNKHRQTAYWYGNEINVANDIDLHSIGLDSDSLSNPEKSIWNEILGRATELDYKGLGFYNERDYLDVDNAQEYVELLKYKEYFIVEDIGELTDGWGDNGNYSWLVTHDYEEAKLYFDSLKILSEDPREIVKKTLSSPLLKEYSDCINVRIMAEIYDSVRYNITFQNFLLIEKAKELSAEEIKSQVLRLQKLQLMIGAHHCVLKNLYKARREWNSNQRYYNYEISKNGNVIIMQAHIPSKMQNTVRFTLDYFEPGWIEKIENDAKYEEHDL